ncbi:DUF7542 family protein [Halorubrum vacuolatum]|uniref:Uncharacterized protein n=1 Tax=Halorubrum vacuolatum TaxID=63740 RepID=A0A238X2G6_HALVU|nr:hypothetical protein [Halorubrum vacuolatum]SNR52773.1 hypothetical protein SAMN06264855_11267 [Halorubrum vacuolatum]
MTDATEGRVTDTSEGRVTDTSNEGRRTAVTVDCADCGFDVTYRRLREARVGLARHEAETGHAVDWRIERLSAGVERAGDAAGVCGIPERGDEACDGRFPF